MEAATKNASAAEAAATKRAAFINAAQDKFAQMMAAKKKRNPLVLRVFVLEATFRLYKGNDALCSGLSRYLCRKSLKKKQKYKIDNSPDP